MDTGGEVEATQSSGVAGDGVVAEPAALEPAGAKRKGPGRRYEPGPDGKMVPYHVGGWGKNPNQVRKNYEMAAVEGGPLSIPEIVSRYLAGESMQVLAAEAKTNRRMLYRWMLAELGGEKYREVVTEALVARIADADESLDNAATKEEIMKAREVGRFARQDFERRRPNLYGAKQEQLQAGLVIHVDRSCGGAVQVGVVGGSNVALELREKEALPRHVGGEIVEGSDGDGSGN